MSLTGTTDTPLQRLGWSLRWHIDRMPARAVARGVPASWLGWRGVPSDSLRSRLARHPGTGTLEVVHPAAMAANPLPRNMTDRDELPADAGWWGYSFRDVPARRSAETLIATLSDCRIVPWFDERGQFHPAILTRDDRSVDLREIRFRPGHAATMRGAMRAGREPVRLDRATWVLERVYDNHSHWLTAHLPKLCLLKARGDLGRVVLPRHLPPTIEASLCMLGIDPAALPRHDPTRILEVERLTILSTDRFRPELLRPVRDALAIRPDRPPWRRVFISREGAARRRLLNEASLWPVLREAGFERVRMEDLSFPEQVRLMGETTVLLAPHGAGLTNMMFCAEGTQVVELADLSFPNPNFYALASAMGLGYRLVRAEATGDGRALDRDLHVDVDAVADVVRRALPDGAAA